MRIYRLKGLVFPKIRATLWGSYLIGVQCLGVYIQVPLFWVTTTCIYVWAQRHGFLFCVSEVIGVFNGSTISKL